MLISSTSLPRIPTTFQNGILALQARKHVLCEKPFTVTAEQAGCFVNLARKKNVFVIEAMWATFMPISKKIRDLVCRGEVGNVSRVLQISPSTESRERPGI